MQGYNGWKNRQTWNVSLWIGNNEPLYRAAVEFMKTHRKSRCPYIEFVKWAGLEGNKTPDGIKWNDKALSYTELNAMMKELE